jgi:hypothetical protein
MHLVTRAPRAADDVRNVVVASSVWSALRWDEHLERLEQHATKLRE